MELAPMTAFDVICVFCEDVRDELSGQQSLIGILPDIINIEGPPPPTPNSIAHLPKLGCYLRAHFFTEGGQPKEVMARIENNKGAVIARTQWKPEMVTQAFDNANSNQMPFAGLIFKFVMGPVPIGAPGGRLTAILTVDGEDSVAGALNIILPTASPHPVSQF
jgi:hypothetical protein